MQVKLKRMTKAVPVTIGTDTTTASAVRLEDAAGFALLVGPLTASVTVNVYASNNEGDGGRPFVDGGSVFSLTLPADAGGSCHALPEGLFGAAVIRLVSSATLTGTVVMKT
jgi:hypothetical protein